MPNIGKKSNSFNLIKKEVIFERKLKSETSWYSSFNFLVILSITAFGGLAYAFTLFNASNLNNKKVEVVNYANQNVNVDDKVLIQEKINVLNDKFSLYQEVKGQSIDASQFYENVSGLYPGIKVNKFSYKPGQNIEAQVILPVNAYEELPEFLTALYGKYGNVNVNQVIFESSSSNSQETSSATTALISLTFKRSENSTESFQ